MSMTRVEVGDKVTMEMPFSEVCVHLQVAGRSMVAEVLGRGVQLYTMNGDKVSFPILHSEAGMYSVMHQPHLWDVPTEKVLKHDKGGKA